MNPVFPLLALRAFTEVAKYQSIKLAAESMGVTSGAVSQQIRQIEERFNVQLFIRSRIKMELTDAGKQIFPTLLTAFDQIESAMHTLTQVNNQKSIRISTMPSFAASWLVPRLGDFKQLHPEIEIHIDASSHLVNLQRDNIDIAIRHGLGNYPNLISEPLMAPVLLPVASPTLLNATKPILQPEDCLNYPLLQDSDRADWSLWLNAHGVIADNRAEQGSAFGDDYLLMKAAIAGQGIALVPQEYALDEIAEGKLVKVLDLPWPAQFAYYLVTLPHNHRPEVQYFMQWILSEAKKMQI